MENYQKGLEHLKTLGYKIIKPKTDLTPLDYSLATYYVVMPAEVSANLSRFDGIRFGFYKEGKNLLEDYKNSRGEGFGKEPRRRIILGTYVLSSGYYDAYYGKAMMVRELLKDTFEKLHELLQEFKGSVDKNTSVQAQAVAASTTAAPAAAKSNTQQAAQAQPQQVDMSGVINAINQLKTTLTTQGIKVKNDTGF
jgi:Asp-tRNA(Asn)/Glu-tRNA(Gln) amidotransferase A subunit family amidase